jgi:predicted dinucleotide-binding enzyme
MNMKIGILGTGMVGETLATKLAARGHDVKMGARAATNEKAARWASAHGGSHGTFADAAAHGELIFNCTKGDASIEALRAAGAEHLRGKVLVDVSNPLDFSKGMPPTLFVSGDDSLGERIQRELPATKVVKALNTVNCHVMADATRLGADSDVFLSGDDAGAKQVVARLLREDFGWTSVVDLGDLSTARGTESYLPLWIRLWGALKTPDFNIKLVVKKG